MGCRWLRTTTAVRDRLRCWWTANGSGWCVDESPSGSYWHLSAPEDPHQSLARFNSLDSTILPVAFGGELSYPRFPLEIACNQISMTQPLPLRSVSGVIPNI